jgi:hypothetical protein
LLALLCYCYHVCDETISITLVHQSIKKKNNKQIHLKV